MACDRQQKPKEIDTRSRRYKLDLSNSGIKKIPDCVIGLPHRKDLIIKNCSKLVSLQSLPPLLLKLDATDCVSLKTVNFSFYQPKAYITLNDCECVKSDKEAIRVSASFHDPVRRFRFLNCLKLDEEARRVIIQQWDYKHVLLPCKEVPAEFIHKAKGNSIAISSGTFSTSSRFKACLLLSPTLQIRAGDYIDCRLTTKGVLINDLRFSKLFDSFYLQMEHLLVFSGSVFKEHRCLEDDETTGDIQFEFSCWKEKDENIIECCVQILADDGESSRNSKQKEHNDGVVESSNHIGWWSWLMKLCQRKKKREPNSCRIS